MQDDLLPLIDDIRSLIDAPATGEGAPALARLEETLTAGYARALTLEAETLRLGRRLGELASTMAGDRSDGAAEELGAVARQLAVSEDDVARLRELLVALRGRAAAARAGAAVA